MELVSGAFGIVFSVATVMTGVEMCNYIRRRGIPPANAEVAGKVAEELAIGLAEADFERAERKGKLYTEAQKDAHRKALRGRLKLGIDKYVTACKGGKR